MSGSTFRKMRLNTTHNVHLQDSNTRRLRLWILNNLFMFISYHLLNIQLIPIIFYSPITCNFTCVFKLTMDNAISIQKLYYPTITSPFPLNSPLAKIPEGASTQVRSKTCGWGWGAKLPIFYYSWSTLANNL